MRNGSIIIVLGVAMLCAASPATRPIQNLADVDANYLTRATAAKREFDSEMAKAAGERLQALRGLEDRAMKAQDLDQAIEIKNRIDGLKSGKAPVVNDAEEEPLSPEIKARRILESRLGDTRWHEDRVVRPNTIWTLNKDGSVNVSDGRTAKWSAIGSNTIMILTNDGYADVWQFDDELKTIHDVHGKLSERWDSVRAN